MRRRPANDYEGTNWNVVAEAALAGVPEFAEQVLRYSGRPECEPWGRPERQAGEVGGRLRDGCGR